MAFAVTNTFTTGTIVAAEVNANFTDIENELNALGTDGDFNSSAVDTDAIANEAVTAAKLGLQAVETANIKLLAVDTGQIKDDAVTADKLAAGAGWTPTVYAGQESVTSSNGMVVKSGYQAGSGTQTITFAAAFSTAIVGVQLTLLENNTSDRVPVKVKSVTTTELVIYASNGGTGCYWEVKGY